MARGGRRQGRAGANYGNRTDLQLGARLPVQAPSGGAYGARKALEDQQRAVPLRAVPSGGVARPRADGGGGVLGAAPPPLDAPTDNPLEPVTAGSAFGEGPGPEVLAPGMTDTTADELRALYLRFPNDDLRRLVEALDRR